MTSTSMDHTKTDTRPALIHVHGITIDPRKWQVVVDGKPISLTSYQFRMLQVLASNAGKTLTRQQIVERFHRLNDERLHGPNDVVTEHALNLRIRVLRKRLGDHGRLIRTVRRNWLPLPAVEFTAIGAAGNRHEEAGATPSR